MNNITQKNVINGLKKNDGLPYSEKAHVDQYQQCRELNTSDINHGLQQLLDNDLYIENYLNMTSGYVEGPKGNIESTVKSANNGYKVYGDIDSSDCLDILRKYENPTSSTIYKQFSGDIKFINQINGRIFAGTGTGIYFSDDPITGFSQLECPDGLSINGSYQNGNNLLLACTSGVYLVSSYIDMGYDDETREYSSSFGERIYSVEKLNSQDVGNVKSVSINENSKIILIGVENGIKEGKYSGQITSTSNIENIYFEDRQIQYKNNGGAIQAIDLNCIEQFDETDGYNAIAGTNLGILEGRSELQFPTKETKQFPEQCIDVIGFSGNVYVATVSGVYRYGDPQNMIISGRIISTTSSSKYLYLATEDKIFTIDSSGNVGEDILSRITSSNSLMDGATINTIFSDGNGIFIGTSENGLIFLQNSAIIDPVEIKLKENPEDTEQRIYGITGIFVKDGLLFISNQNGLYAMDVSYSGNVKTDVIGNYEAYLSKYEENVLNVFKCLGKIFVVQRDGVTCLDNDSKFVSTSSHIVFANGFKNGDAGKIAVSFEDGTVRILGITESGLPSIGLIPSMEDGQYAVKITETQNQVFILLDNGNIYSFDKDDQTYETSLKFQDEEYVYQKATDIIGQDGDLYVLNDSGNVFVFLENNDFLETRITGKINRIGHLGMLNSYLFSDESSGISAFYGIPREIEEEESEESEESEEDEQSNGIGTFTNSIVVKFDGITSKINDFLVVDDEDSGENIVYIAGDGTIDERHVEETDMEDMTSSDISEFLHEDRTEQYINVLSSSSIEIKRLVHGETSIGECVFAASDSGAYLQKIDKDNHIECEDKIENGVYFPGAFEKDGINYDILTIRSSGNLYVSTDDLNQTTDFSIDGYTPYETDEKKFSQIVDDTVYIAFGRTVLWYTPSDEDDGGTEIPASSGTIQIPDDGQTIIGIFGIQNITSDGEDSYTTIAVTGNKLYRIQGTVCQALNDFTDTVNQCSFQNIMREDEDGNVVSDYSILVLKIGNEDIRTVKFNKNGSVISTGFFEKVALPAGTSFDSDVFIGDGCTLFSLKDDVVNVYSGTFDSSNKLTLTETRQILDEDGIIQLSKSQTNDIIYKNSNGNVYEALNCEYIQNIESSENIVSLSYSKNTVCLFSDNGIYVDIRSFSNKFHKISSIGNSSVLDAAFVGDLIVYIVYEGSSYNLYSYDIVNDSIKLEIQNCGLIGIHSSLEDENCILTGWSTENVYQIKFQIDDTSSIKELTYIENLIQKNVQSQSEGIEINNLCFLEDCGKTLITCQNEDEDEFEQDYFCDIMDLDQDDKPEFLVLGTDVVYRPSDSFKMEDVGNYSGKRINGFVLDGIEDVYMFSSTNGIYRPGCSERIVTTGVSQCVYANGMFLYKSDDGWYNYVVDKSTSLKMPLGIETISGVQMFNGSLLAGTDIGLLELIFVNQLKYTIGENQKRISKTSGITNIFGSNANRLLCLQTTKNGFKSLKKLSYDALDLEQYSSIQVSETEFIPVVSEGEYLDEIDSVVFQNGTIDGYQIFHQNGLYGQFFSQRMNIRVNSVTESKNIKSISNINGKYYCTFESDDCVRMVKSPSKETIFTLQYNIENTRYIVNVGSGSYTMASDNGIYFWNNGKFGRTREISGVHAISKYIENDKNMYLYEMEKSLYVSENTKYWKKLWDISISYGNMNCMLRIDGNTYMFGTDDGLYSTKYSYEMIHDTKNFSYQDAIDMYNESMSSTYGISSIIGDALENHISTQHSDGSLIKELNEEYLDVNLQEVSGWTDSNDYISSHIVNNDIVNEMEFGTYGDGDVTIYLSSYINNEGEVVEITGHSYIMKRWSSGITELYIYIPTTNTYYLANIYGASNCNVSPYLKYTRKNLSDFSTDKQTQDGQLSSHFTNITVGITSASYTIDDVMDIQINGNSLPLKIYKDTESLGGNSGFSGQMYRSFVEPSVVRDYDISQTNESGYYLFNFACFGSDAQAIKLMFYDHNARSNRPYVKIQFNSNGGSGEMAQQKFIIDENGMIERKNLKKCSFENTMDGYSKVFMGWTISPQTENYSWESQEYDGSQIYEDQSVFPGTEDVSSLYKELLVDGEIQNKSTINLYAVWLTYNFTDADTTLTLDSNQSQFAINSVSIIPDTNLKDNVVINFGD